MKLHNLVLREKTSIAQQLPKDLENKIGEFRRQVTMLDKMVIFLMN